MKLKSKSWSKDLEKPIYEKWKSAQQYKFSDTGRKLFSIDTPPPYVNTPIHIGHAATYTLMDMFARFHRMLGHDVLFPLGLDRNGLPIEVATEKRFGVSMREVSREEFISLCKKLLEESSAESIDSFMKLGISFNSWNVGNGIGDIYFTDSDEYRTLTQATFIDLWNRGLVYEDERVNNYCPGCRTTIADAEIDYAEKPSFFNDIIFTVAETKEKIVLGTTRPELIASCGTIIYNPEDKRYQHLKGKHAITPVYNERVPIQPHSYADMEKGTGLMMMCAFGDQADIRFFRDMKIAPKLLISQDGRMNSNAGFLEGLHVKQARKKILEELKAKNLLASQQNIMHRTPICERSKDEIEFIAMKEFYLKQVEFKEDMRKIAAEIEFYAPQSRQMLLDWIDAVSIDWPISRRRYYATEIPLWYCTECADAFIPPKGRYYKPWSESPPIAACKCGSTRFVGEDRVFDTWFDSSNSPLHILQYGKNDEFFRRHFPCTLRPQGREIIRTWLYYTLLKSHLLTNKPAFRDVWIHYHIVDERGIKMSKSIGNIIDPHKILEQFGAEPFRLWCVLEGNLDRDDMKCSLERIQGAGKTLTKLWNIASFVAQFEWTQLKKISAFEPELIDVSLECLDKWIISEMNEIINYSRERYERYDFHNPAVRIRHFIWEIFASHYIELVKNRAYNQSSIFTKEQQRSAIFTLNYCLNALLKLLAPVMPYITHVLYQDIYKEDVHSQHFPKIMPSESELATGDIEELNNAVWKAKKDNALSLRAEISLLTIPEKFAPAAKDIAATHSTREIKYGPHIEVKI